MHQNMRDVLVRFVTELANASITSMPYGRTEWPSSISFIRGATLFC